VLGLDLDRVAAAPPETADVPPDVATILEQRAAARAARDFALSDRLRDRLAELGYAVIDGPEGQTVTGSRDPGGGRSGR